MDPVPIVASALLALALVSLPPLVDGVERKVRASIQSRIGPPIIQTWLDIAKLLAKEPKLPEGSELAALTALLSVAISVALLCCLAAFTAARIVGVGATLAIVMLIASLHSLSLVTACTTANPFAAVGSFRRVALTIVNEAGLLLAIALALYSVQLYPKSPLPLAVSTAMLVVSSFANSGRLPYDLHEAEPELASGTVIELSGPFLAAELYSHLAERMALAALPTYVVVAATCGNVVLRCILFLASSVGLWILYATTSTLLGRSRVDLAMKSLGAVYASMAIAWTGVVLLC